MKHSEVKSGKNKTKKKKELVQYRTDKFRHVAILVPKQLVSHLLPVCIISHTFSAFVANKHEARKHLFIPISCEFSTAPANKASKHNYIVLSSI